jgi:hypothetical protein
MTFLLCFLREVPRGVEVCPVRLKKFDAVQLNRSLRPTASPSAGPHFHTRSIPMESGQAEGPSARTDRGFF